MEKNTKIKDSLKRKISDKKLSWMEQAEYYENNRNWLDKSASIALKVLRHLRANNVSQKDLAEQLNVSPQYVNKIIKGKENLSLETICKIETVLNITLIEIPSYEVSKKISADYQFSLDSFTVSRNVKKVYVSELKYDETILNIVPHNEEVEEAA